MGSRPGAHLLYTWWMQPVVVRPSAPTIRTAFSAIRSVDVCDMCDRPCDNTAYCFRPACPVLVDCGTALARAGTVCESKQRAAIGNGWLPQHYYEARSLGPARWLLASSRLVVTC